MKLTQTQEASSRLGYMVATQLAVLLLLSFSNQVSIASSTQTEQKISTKKSSEDLLSSTEQLLNLPQGFLRAICAVETGLKADIVVMDTNGLEAIGLCQVQVPAYMHMFNIRHLSAKKRVAIKKELLKPSSNAFVAGLYLRYQYKRYGNWDKAIVAYNAGRYIKSRRYLNKVKKELYAQN